MNKAMIIIEAYRLGYLDGVRAVLDENDDDVNESLQTIQTLLKKVEESEVAHE